MPGGGRLSPPRRLLEAAHRPRAAPQSYCDEEEEDEGAAARRVRAEEVDKGRVLQALQRAEDANLVRGEREGRRRDARASLCSRMEAGSDVVGESVGVEAVCGDGEAEGAAGENVGGLLPVASTEPHS